MFRTRSFTSRTISCVLLVALTAPSAFAQALAPKPSAPATPPPGAAAPPAAAPPAAASPAAAPPAAAPPAAAPLPPFKKSLADTLSGAAKAEYEAGRLLY